jgi:hypothetical protein
VARGIHLGLWLGLARLGLRAWRRGRIGTVALAGVRRFGCKGELRSTLTRAEGTGMHAGAYRGLGLAGAGVKAAVDGGRAVEVVEARGEGQRRGTPGCWAPWIASGGACGGVQGVRTAKTPPAARKLPWRSSSTAAAPWQNFGDAEARGSIARLGELPGAEVKLL